MILMQREELFEKYEEMVELLGSDDLLLNLVTSLSNDELQSSLEFIDRVHDTNVFYNGPWVSEVQTWAGKVLKTFEFEEYNEGCEFEAILYKEELARIQAREEWEDDRQQCIKDGYNTMEDLENAISEDLYIYSYNKQGQSIPVNFG